MDTVDWATLLFNTLQKFDFFFFNVWITNWMVLKGGVRQETQGGGLDR